MGSQFEIIPNYKIGSWEHEACCSAAADSHISGFVLGIKVLKNETLSILTSHARSFSYGSPPNAFSFCLPACPHPPVSGCRVSMWPPHPLTTVYPMCGRKSHHQAGMTQCLKVPSLAEPSSINKPPTGLVKTTGLYNYLLRGQAVTLPALAGPRLSCLRLVDKRTLGAVFPSNMWKRSINGWTGPWWLRLSVEGGCFPAPASATSPFWFHVFSINQRLRITSFYCFRGLCKILWLIVDFFF